MRRRGSGDWRIGGQGGVEVWRLGVGWSASDTTISRQPKVSFFACYPCLSGSVVVLELVKWGGYGLMRFSGQVDGEMSWRVTLPQSLRTCARSEPSTLLSKLMSERACSPSVKLENWNHCELHPTLPPQAHPDALASIRLSSSRPSDQARITTGRMAEKLSLYVLDPYQTIVGSGGTCAVAAATTVATCVAPASARGITRSMIG